MPRRENVTLQTWHLGITPDEVHMTMQCAQGLKKLISSIVTLIPVLVVLTMLVSISHNTAG